MKIKLYSLIVLLLPLSFCTKDNFDNLDYFAFGDAHGFCLGNCANFFLIKDGDIYPDDIDRYYDSTLKFKSEALTTEKYELARTVIDCFPSYLLDHPNTTYGCPDCADQGGIHIEIMENGQIKRWHFDTNISNLPSKIRDYVQNIAVVLEQLK
jgi:hypothetical protein